MRGFQDDQSTSSSIPGAVRETEGHRYAKGSRRGLGADASLRLVDENIQQRLDYSGNEQNEDAVRPGAVSETGYARRMAKPDMDVSSDVVDGERFRYQPGANMQSVADSRYEAKMRNTDGRMEASLRATEGMISTRSGLDGSSAEGGSKPGVYRGDTPQGAAIQAKLDAHFGTEEVDEREGDFSHVGRLAAPRPVRPAPSRQPSTASRLPASRQASSRIGTNISTRSEELVSQEFEDEFDEDGSKLPRELTVDEELARKRGLSKWKRMKDKPQLWCLTKTAIFITFCFFAAGAGLFFGLYIFGPDSEEDVGNTANEEEPVGFEEGLPPATLAILAENDPDTPQYKAMQWLQEEELFLSYPAWHKKQRYALATIYFALYHDEEQQDQPWFQHDVDECDWLWNLGDPSICDTDGRYTRLSLRLDAREQENVMIPDLGDSSKDRNFTETEAVPAMSIVMPLEVAMLNIARLVLTNAPEHTELGYLWPKELLESPDLIELEVKMSPQVGGTVSCFRYFVVVSLFWLLFF